MKPTFVLSPSLSALPKAIDGHVDVLVQLSAPAMPVQADRPTLNLAIVIDRSGSMAGPPLAEAKRAAIHLINKLQKGDLVCVASYGSSVELHTEPMDAHAGRQQLIAAVERLTSNGGTPLRAGWLCGANAIAPFVSKYGLSRVLLLSDGQATDGSQPELLAEEARQLMGAGISTSTYGLGLNFNEELMTKLAQGGQAFYAETADNLVAYFESEFDMLSATVGRQVRVDLSAKLGKQALKVERLDTGEAVSGSVFMAPLVAGAASWVALRLTHAGASDKDKLEIQATVHWVSLDGVSHQLEQSVTVPVRAKSKPGQDEAALERLKEAEASRLQREALASARRGDWAQTDHILMNLCASAGSNAYVAGVAASLSSVSATRDLGRFSKEALYSSHTMSNRIVDTDEQVDVLEGGRFGLRKAEQGKAVKKQADRS
jgi:Ca-activated chloride channel family protein